MFHKVHLRSTCLCTAITGSILLIITLAYLFVAERNLNATSFASFQNDIATLVNTLESQSLLSHEWLAKQEASGKYMISITDNDSELYYEENRDPKFLTYLEEFKSTYVETPADTTGITSFRSVHREFHFRSNDNTLHYAAFSFIQKEQGLLQLYILYPLHNIQAQIWQQRL